MVVLGSKPDRTRDANNDLYPHKNRRKAEHDRESVAASRVPAIPVEVLVIAIGDGI